MDAQPQMPLDELLRHLQREGPHAELLLDLLGAAGLDSAEAIEQISTALHVQPPARLAAGWEELVEWLADWPSPPEAPNQLRPWLLEFEAIGLASLGMSQLRQVPERVREGVDGLLDRRHAALSEREDLGRFSGLAAQRIEDWGRDVAPWSWLKDVGVEGLRAQGADAPRRVAELWIDGQLAPRAAERVRRDFGDDAPLKQAYAAVVRQRLAEIHVTRWSAKWSLDVARTREDLDFVLPRMVLALPHADSSIAVWLHEDGLWWRTPEGEALLPFDVGVHKLSIPSLGDLTARVVVHVPTSAQDLGHGLASLRRIAAATFPNEAREFERLAIRAEEVVDAFVSVFEGGALAIALVEGHRAFEDGLETSDELLRLVRHALEARLELSPALGSLSSFGRDVAPLQSRLERTDEQLSSASSSLQLLEEDDYLLLTEGVEIDTSTWWGARHLLDRRVPPGAVESVLIAMGRSDAAPRRADIIDLASRRPTALPLLWTKEATALAAADVKPRIEPCAWLRSAEAREPECGHVALLLFDEETQRGVAAELEVELADRAAETELWQGAHRLNGVAREAIRTAYGTVGALTPTNLAPYALQNHRLRLHLPDEHLPGRSIEGSSLGLAAALAFASLWTKTKLPPTLVASGRLAGRSVAPVAHVTEKAQAAIQLAGEARIHLLVSAENAADAARLPLDICSVSSLDQAFAVARLDLELVPQDAYPSTVDARDWLRQKTSDVQVGRTSRTEAAWLSLAGEMERLIAFLAGRNQTDLDKHRCWTALAYTHAGDTISAQRVLKHVRHHPNHRLEVRILVNGVSVASLIDSAEDERAQLTLETEPVRNLVQNIREAYKKKHARVLGFALGTLGRVYLHTRDPRSALAHFQTSLKHHQDELRHEAARSRIYLTMALRMIGELDTAMAQLRDAEHELDTVTQEYSAQYASTCRMYLYYERSRVLVAQERYDEALSAANTAYEDARWIPPWPLLGILRVRAWAHRILGEDALADADVAAMEQLSFPMKNLQRRLINEARGFPSEGDEVY